MDSNDKSGDKSSEWSATKKFFCRFCGKFFGKSQALGGHMNGHRQERDQESYKKAVDLVQQKKGKMMMAGQSSEFVAPQNYSCIPPGIAVQMHAQTSIPPTQAQIGVDGGAGSSSLTYLNRSFSAQNQNQNFPFENVGDGGVEESSILASYLEQHAFAQNLSGHEHRNTLTIPSQHNLMIREPFPSYGYQTPMNSNLQMGGQPVVGGGTGEEATAAPLQQQQQQQFFNGQQSPPTYPHFHPPWKGNGPPL